MTIFTKGLPYSCEFERVARLFFPFEDIHQTKDEEDFDDLHCEITLTGNELVTFAESKTHLEKFVGTGLSPVRNLWTGESPVPTSISALSRETLAEPELVRLAAAKELSAVLESLTGYSPPWGVLTGVRPVKLLRALCKEQGEHAACDIFRGLYGCSEEKLELAMRTMEGEQPVLDLSDSKSFSLYISIPFCKTRCSYCSFVSQSIERAAYLIPDYVNTLIREIESTAEIAKSLGLRLETVYMGGGTPTTLSANQLSSVLEAVNRYFDICNSSKYSFEKTESLKIAGRNFQTSSLREYTVEAGRPDTITREKIAAIRAAGVDRISINPQTLNDDILKEIGRNHTSGQIYEAMDMARHEGFSCINMDLIAGLPGDDYSGFAKSLSGVIDLAPENVTIHTLSVKKASQLSHNTNEFDPTMAVQKMLELADKSLTAAEYSPYYLYRQQRMLGNLENVGWQRGGHPGFYNVYIMDETHTILAVGAGGVTKLKQPGVNHIERIFNFKFPYEYLSRFDEINSRKKGIAEFYEKFC